MSIILSSISQGLLWSVMAIGVYLTFRILDIADLTAEGSFPLGAAVCASLIVAGIPPWLSTIAALIAGMLAGTVSGLLHTVLKIPALLTGILTMTALYSINLRIMGKANVTLLGQGTLMRTMQSFGLNSRTAVLAVGALVALLVILVLYLFFNTETGLAIRSTGDNEDMSEANGIHTNAMKIIGYMLSNGLIALSGALIAQNNSYADIGMGIGTIVIGLASVIIGEVIFHNLSFAKRLVTIVIGAVVYRLIIDLVLQLGVDPQDIKLFSALILAIALSTPLLKKKSGKILKKSPYAKKKGVQ
ncbi:MAG: ABC transporter permease [Carnobacterium sp.]|uniref:ABC transporter permease n=1 Tax=Carnobacterium antarcticum TaxID=2126436 RepID=A0ABW4NQA5_9LACT|nr:MULTISPECIES: ABC transporter permease [unclassified Carnobacterium]ALV22921.1 ABC transporter permease protein [Carnobacterium sp. CP1]QQP70808.1 ABC transporter permease [Carnobacterium sp. CS13]